MTNEFKLRILLLGFVWILVLGNSSFAYRPFGTEDAGVAGKGVVQTETSFDSLKWNDGKTERNFLLVPIYGLTDNLEVSAEILRALRRRDSNAPAVSRCSSSSGCASQSGRVARVRLRALRAENLRLRHRD